MFYNFYTFKDKGKGVTRIIDHAPQGRNFWLELFFILLIKVLILLIIIR